METSIDRQGMVTQDTLMTDPVAVSSPGRRWSELRRDLVLLLLLAALACGLRFWQARHTKVVSRDSLAFMRFAWQLEHQPWREVLPATPRHPGYSVTILAASRVVRLFRDDPDNLIWQLSAQLASAAASVLLVIPMFYLGREVFDRMVGFWACVLIQCLPASSRVLADGLSEAAYLLCAVTAMLAAARGLRGGRAGWFAVCGASGALAYLIRPEGALVPAAAGLVLLAGQASAWRRPWRSMLACGSALTLAGLVLAGPYVAVIGQLTVKPTAKLILERPTAHAEPLPPAECQGPCAGPLFASVEAGRWDVGVAGRVWRSLYEVVREVVEGSFFVAIIPTLLGLWWFRDRFRLVPGTCVMLLVCLVLMLLLWRVAWVLGYTSSRHLLLVTVCASYWAVAGFRELPLKLAALLPRLLSPVRRLLHSRLTAPVLLLLLAASGLPKSLTPLHADRAGFRTAGCWLAGHSAPTDPVVDPSHFSAFYSGRLFPAKPSARSADDDRTHYVVLTDPPWSGRDRSRTPRAEKLAAQGSEVFRTPLSLWKDKPTEVVVYAVSPP